MQGGWRWQGEWGAAEGARRAFCGPVRRVYIRMADALREQGSAVMLDVCPWAQMRML